MRLSNLLILTLLALPCSAQEFLGLRASGCGQLNAEARFVLNVDQTIPAGRHVIASVVVANTGLTGNVVEDLNGTSYVVSGVTGQNGMLVMTFIGYLNAPLVSGAFVRHRADSGSGTAACLHVSEFSGIIPTSFANYGSGVSASAMATASQSATLDMPLGSAPAQLIGATGSNADPGTVTPTGTSVLVAKTCRTAPNLCLFSTRRVAPNAGVVHSIGTTTQNSVVWTSTISAFLGTLLFQNGYE